MNLRALAALSLAATAFAQPSPLLTQLKSLALESDGRVGICALAFEGEEAICVRGDETFSPQSVMKLVVAAAVMGSADRGTIGLSNSIVVRPEDVSPGPREFSDLVRKDGSVSTTVEDLMKRAVVDSDSTSVDVLIGRLGGISAIQGFLKTKRIEGIRVDRDERHLQTESQGLRWRPTYANPTTLDEALAALPTTKRNAAWGAYLKDPRDTATPLGMVRFLKSLGTGKLLSEKSTQKLLEVLSQTKTGPDRLAGGLPQGWRLGHKTGTSPSWQGIVAATNDVGILTAPGGGRIAVAVFIADSKKDSRSRANLIAKAAKIITDDFTARENGK